MEVGGGEGEGGILSAILGNGASSSSSSSSSSAVVVDVVDVVGIGVGIVDVDVDVVVIDRGALTAANLASAIASAVADDNISANIGIGPATVFFEVARSAASSALFDSFDLLSALSTFDDDEEEGAAAADDDTNEVFFFFFFFGVGRTRGRFFFVPFFLAECIGTMGSIVF